MQDSRFTLKELPPRPADAVESFQLRYRLRDREERYTLAEGETHVGSSARCALRIEAPGIRARHFCLKRSGSQVFMRAYSRARVTVDGRPVGDRPEPVQLGQTIAFGPVRAVLERLQPADHVPAVQVQPAAAPPGAVGFGRSAELYARPLRALNERLLQCVTQPAAVRYEHLLDVLHACLAPEYAALARRGPRGSWAMLAEVGQHHPPVPDPACAVGLLRFDTRTRDGMDLVLLTGLPDEAPSAWQQEVCRQVLTLAVLLHDRRDAGRTAAALPPSAPPPDPWHAFVGQAIRTHLEETTDACRYTDCVLVLGETGTGKELMAQALHRLWGRPGAFVALNCAAIPEALLDAELFGVEQGAATGVAARTGRFEQARGGTLFLDEISEMPLSLQSKLLRVLQERTFFRVGGTRLLEADIHIVAASNRTDAELRGGERMRPDLYFRLAQTVVTLPPLRARPDDCAALCTHILNTLEQQYGRGVTGLSVSALERLKQYAWPGNIRELQNLLRTLYARTPRGHLIQSADLPAAFYEEPRPTATAPPEGTLAAIVAEVERQVILRELDRQPGIPAAARALGLSVGYFYRKLKKLGIDR